MIDFVFGVVIGILIALFLIKNLDIKSLENSPSETHLSHADEVEPNEFDKTFGEYDGFY